MYQIRLLIAEDHTIVRQGLVNILTEYPDICIIAEAEDGNALVKKFSEFNPDVILSDISMPNLDGISAAKIILDKKKDAKIIFLTMFDSDEYIFKIFKSGASGFVSKDVIKHELIFAIRKVFSGEKYFMGKTDEELESIINKYKKIVLTDDEIKRSSLTERELEILEQIAKGFKSTDIAKKLSLSKRTIDSCRSTIMAKLNVQTLPQLIKLAVEISYNRKKPPNI